MAQRDQRQRWQPDLLGEVCDDVMGPVVGVRVAVLIGEATT